ncbi:Sir2 family NAD-dependent protein deacetylase [Colwellia sp. E2M01]|uniref:SIR2 family NAD-dependent protein deacylase n=1 Tax=Colwellia sp. E2M01 TaxID=2841561 RepID=UPI001C098A6C|nr:Sir2 family NAD-dependent protein deacetylase [Colwellia sp. E2M01]MBU2872119.1 hypothetical protein [Colwellia sp. E2M01]
MRENIEAAAKLISDADAILIGAGAGMGVDSGLPDFRGKQGFWNTYPQLKHLNKSFQEMASSDLFLVEPELVWWFYGHRFNLYKNTAPHDGFDILKRLSLSKPTFVFTSNVDGHFQKSGFNNNQVIERHGSINHLQCSYSCCDDIWKITRLPFKINNLNISIEGHYPHCPNCGGIARPNIMMFNDQWWVSGRARQQNQNFYDWLDTHWGKNIVAIEIGAGTEISTVRTACLHNAKNLIRINPFQCDISKGQIPLKMSALDALIEIDKLLF